MVLYSALRCACTSPPQQKYLFAHISVWSTHLNILQAVAHVLHPHVIANHRLVDVCVRRQQLRSSESFPPHPGRASLQTQDLTSQAAPGVCAEPVLALSAGPRLLLVRRRWLVEGVNVEGVAEVGVGVAGLRVGDGLVRRREVRRLEVRRGRMWEWGRWAVQVLTDRRQVRQPGIPIAVSVVPFLEETEVVRRDRKMAGGDHVCPPREGKKVQHRHDVHMRY